ncbi:MAG: 50S ribosomal protein L7/L12 [Gemmataceae bacterium]|nr:50S ribosomal protein L7/L12 [Gemmataceae bacterium]MCS7269695.1 50S ribosomal protein L7/L12 [Gemmataceae bacterium]MDW8242342.1 50S ribosomal protein L7/L12 [Thermogemmata sp.]
MPTIAELGDAIAKLTLAEAVELKNYLKEKYQIEPAGGVVMAAAGGPAPGGAAPAAAPAAEPTEFNVILEPGFDAAKKVAIIKVVRELTGQGLGEAKATVEGAPKAIKENVDKKTAEEIKKKLEEAGAKVTIKPAG